MVKHRRKKTFLRKYENYFEERKKSNEIYNTKYHIRFNKICNSTLIIFP